MAAMSNPSGDDGMRRVPKRPASAAPQSLYAQLASRWTTLQTRVSRTYTRVAPFVKSGGDLVWFVGSSALLMSLPILIELQRETTVMMLQRQRENEIAMMQEQARMMNASTIENLRATATQLLGGGAQQQPGGGEGSK